MGEGRSGRLCGLGEPPSSRPHGLCSSARSTATLRGPHVDLLLHGAFLLDLFSPCCVCVGFSQELRSLC